MSSLVELRIGNLPTEASRSRTSTMETGVERASQSGLTRDYQLLFRVRALCLICSLFYLLHRFILHHAVPEVTEIEERDMPWEWSRQLP